MVGTEGYLELRKYVDVTTDNGPNQVILVDSEGEHRLEADGNVGYPFFGELVLDVLHHTENAMTRSTPSRPSRARAQGPGGGEGLTGTEPHGSSVDTRADAHTRVRPSVMLGVLTPP